MTKVNFAYEIEKDVDNFLKGLRSVNNPNPTKLHEEFFEKHGEESDRSLVKLFLEEKTKTDGLDFEAKIKTIETEWRPLEAEFFSRCEKMFEMFLPTLVTGYLSLNSRCTYNWKDNYFFISFHSKNSTLTVMHELLHFYTHRKFEDLIPDRQKFNEIKEALTVLLNLDFKDLMGEQVDEGYEQHQDLRQKIFRLRKEGKTIPEIIAILV